MYFLLPQCWNIIMSHCSSAKQACFSPVAGFSNSPALDYNLIFVSVPATVTAEQAHERVCGEQHWRPDAQQAIQDQT